MGIVDLWTKDLLMNENTQVITLKEASELKNAIAENEIVNIEEEIGDLLFVLVNLARRLEVEPETALKKTNRKFRRRFKFIENELKKSGKSLENSNLKEMDALWNKAKTEEFSGWN